MVQIGPKSIRGKITLLAGAVTAAAMVLVVVVMAFAMRALLENAIADSLDKRVEQAKVAVEAGDYADAVDSSGNEVIQVIDENGNVVAESRNARGLAAVDVEAGTTLEGFALSRVNAGDAHDASSAAHTDEVNRGDGDNPPNNGEEDGDVDEDPDDMRTNDPNYAEGATGVYINFEDDDGDDGKRDGDNAADDAADGDGDDGDEDSDDDDDDDGDDEHGASSGKRRASFAKNDADERNRNNADEGDDDNDDGNDDADDADEKDGGNDKNGDGHDTDDEGGVDGEATTARSNGAPHGVAQLRSNSLAFSFWRRDVAWASLNATGSDAVDVGAVLGVEGPYIVKRQEANSPDGPMSIVAVTSLASAERSALQMAGLLAVIMAGLLVAVIAFAWVLTGRTLRPVEDMRAKAASITAESLNERIAVPHSDKDLARLAETLNGMLERVAHAFDEEKRFISDASHELKSPIAATSMILDALRAHPEALDVSAAVDDLSSENSRMASIVEDMLTLTRYDEGRLNCQPELIDLMDLLLEESLSLKARTSIAVDTVSVQPLVCHADPDLLRHAVRNLLDNAARYADSMVKVSCYQEGETVVVKVSDDGCGVKPADRERVFGRFVCLDEDGAASKSGTGLGLAVVASAVAAHGGTVSFTDPELASGATAVIELPERIQP